METEIYLEVRDMIERWMFDCSDFDDIPRLAHEITDYILEGDYLD